MEHRKELIEHLSSEITTHATNLMTFRSRLAFTVLIGPFVLLGSFLVATRGEVNSDAIKTFDVWAVLAVVAMLGVCVTYFGLGYYGARIDARLMAQCNEWRRLLVGLANFDDTRVKIEVKHQVMRAYRWGFSLVFVAFLSFGGTIWMMLRLKQTTLGP